MGNVVKKNNIMIEGRIRQIIKKKDDVIIRLDYEVAPKYFIDCYFNKNNESIYNAALNNYKKYSYVEVSGELKRIDDMFRINADYISHLNKIKI